MRGGEILKVRSNKHETLQKSSTRYKLVILGIAVEHILLTSAFP